MSPNDLNAIKFSLDENFNIKIIFFKRPVEGQIISRSCREYSVSIANGEKVKIEDLISSQLSGDLIKRHTNIISEINSLVKEHPDKIYILDPENLFRNVNSEMSLICEFLNLANNHILFTPTLAGKPVSNSYLGVFNDEKIKIDSPIKQMLMIKIYGLKYLRENNEQIDWRIIYPFSKLYFFKLIKFIIRGKKLKKFLKKIYERIQFFINI